MSENFGQFVMSVSKLHTLSRGSFVITEWEKETATGPLSSPRNAFRADELGARERHFQLAGGQSTKSPTLARRRTLPRGHSNSATTPACRWTSRPPYQHRAFHDRLPETVITITSIVDANQATPLIDPVVSRIARYLDGELVSLPCCAAQPPCAFLRA
jgi:hypothetical protein